MCEMLCQRVFTVNAVKWQRQGVGWRWGEGGSVVARFHVSEHQGVRSCPPSPSRPPHRGSCFSFSPLGVWPRLPKQMGLFWRSGDPRAWSSLSTVPQVNILSLTKTLHGKPSLWIWSLTNHIVLLQHVDQWLGAALLNALENSGSVQL